MLQDKPLRKPDAMKAFLRKQAALGCSFAALAAMTGCGNSSKPVLSDPTVIASLPAPPAPGPVNAYVGSQSPGLWSLSLDDTKDVFSYKAITFPSNAAVSGLFQASNGFLSFSQAKGSSRGYVLEIQGRGALLRPGDTTAPIVVGVPQAACYPVTSRLRFQFIAMPAGNSPAQNAADLSHPRYFYGSVVASTSSDGASWQFGNLQGVGVAGSTSSPTSMQNAGIAGHDSFTGSCKVASGQASISFTGQQSLLNDVWAPGESPIATPTANTQSNISIGPSGFFVADQSDPTSSTPTGGAVVGVAEPSAPLTTSDVASKSYLGFLYEQANLSAPTPLTAMTTPVSFGQTPSSGTTMIGGIFPNDDVTQTPNSDIQINLGSQDAGENGLYASASITVLDPQQNCANYTTVFGGTSGTPGVNAQGFITCTFPGVAMVGNPEGKYAIFLTTYNFAAQYAGVPMQIYLFQQ